MFSLLRRLCTILGFVVLLLGVLFYFQRYWLNYAVGWAVSTYSPYRWKAESAVWHLKWPLEFEATQAQLKYRSGIAPEDFMRAPRVMVTLRGVPWREGRLQIERLEAQVEMVNWIRFPVPPIQATTATREKNEEPFWKGIQIQELLVEVVGVAYYDRTREPFPPPQLYVLNLKTPLIRGPIQTWDQVEQMIIPGFSKGKRK